MIRRCVGVTARACNDPSSRPTGCSSGSGSRAGSSPPARRRRSPGWPAEHGSGVIELTSRANVQIRGVTTERHRLLVDELVAAGLAHPDPDIDQRRNVVASPTTGLDDGLIDVRPIVEAIVDELMATERSIDPKAGVLIDDGGRFSLRDRRHTVVLHAVRLRVRRGRVPTGRFRRRGRPVACRSRRGRPAPRAGARRHRTDPTGRARRLRRPPAGPPLGAFEPFVGVAPVLGRLDAETLARLADLAHDEIRFTPWRGIVLPGLERTDLGTLPDSA